MGEMIGQRCEDPAAVAVRFKHGRSVHLLCEEHLKLFEDRVVPADDYQPGAGEFCGVMRGGTEYRQVKVLSRALPVHFWDPTIVPQDAPNARRRNWWQALKELFGRTE